jgi:hypothetical protein
LTAQSADLDLALERDQRAQGFVNHLAFVSNAGHPAGALDEFVVNVNVNMHVVRPLYTCAGCVRPPAQGMARVVVVFGPPRRVGRDVMRFSDVSHRMMCSSSLRPRRTTAPDEPGMTLVGVAPRHRR